MVCAEVAPDRIHRVQKRNKGTGTELIYGGLIARMNKKLTPVPFTLPALTAVPLLNFTLPCLSRLSNLIA